MQLSYTYSMTTLYNMCVTKLKFVLKTSHASFHAIAVSFEKKT